MMASANFADYKPYFEQMVEATRAGAMTWTEINPSTFVWDVRTPPHPGRLTLQRIDRQVRAVENMRQVIKTVPSYVLVASDLATGQVVLQVNSEQDESLNQTLGGLYDLIQTQRSRSKLDFLKSLIPPKHEG
jgi:hypothetical protein